MPLGYTVLNWIYMLPPIIGLLVCLRFVRQTKGAGMLAGGFGMIGAVGILSRMVNVLMMRSAQSLPASSTDILARLLPSTFVFSLASLVAWTLIIVGIYQALEENSRKTAVSQLALQNDWNYNAAPQYQHGQAFQAQQGAAPFGQTYPPQTQPQQEDQEQTYEEAHAPAIHSPVPPAPLAQNGRPVLSVQPEQPANSVTLGSGRQ